VLGPWFVQQQQRNFKPQGDVAFIDPPVSSAVDLPCEGTTLLERLRDERHTWLHGRSGMGKTSLFAAWKRAYFAEVGLDAAVRRYGFILVTLSVRDYADIEALERNRPESWVLEAVRQHLPRPEQFESVSAFYATSCHEHAHNADRRVMPRRSDFARESQAVSTRRYGIIKRLRGRVRGCYA
jgi:hypothetical protein